MPIYEYTCKRCGNFEIMQRISEDPLKKCPTCGAKVSKLISRSAFHLKGNGWYATDYGKNGASKTDDSKSTTNETKTNATKENDSSTTSSSSSASPPPASTSTAKESSAAS
jgi:putative FmdB family regulatory protein